MSTLKMRELTIHTHGNLPELGERAPNVNLTRADLSPLTLDDYAGKTILLNVYPSIDTNVCFESVRKFNDFVKEQKDVVIICVSMDLPFALQRIAEGEHLDDIILASDFRNREFGELYGLTIADGPIAGLLARAIIVLDPQHKVSYQELVDDITTPPNYNAAMEVITKGVKPG